MCKGSRCLLPSQLICPNDFPNDPLYKQSSNSISFYCGLIAIDCGRWDGKSKCIIGRGVLLARVCWHYTFIIISQQWMERFANETILQLYNINHHSTSGGYQNFLMFVKSLDFKSSAQIKHLGTLENWLLKNYFSLCYVLLIFFNLCWISPQYHTVCKNLFNHNIFFSVIFASFDL